MWAWVDLIFLALQVFVLSAFFQTFAARRYFLFTITSVLFPIQGILIFILRNNRGMNYREFMRREQERQYRVYQQYYRQNQGSDPYGQNGYQGGNYGDPYSGENSSYGGNSGSSDPFSDLGNSGGNKGGNDDPFDI